MMGGRDRVLAALLREPESVPVQTSYRRFIHVQVPRGFKRDAIARAAEMGYDDVLPILRELRDEGLVSASGGYWRLDSLDRGRRAVTR